MNVDIVSEIVIQRPIDVVAAYAADPSDAPDRYDNIDSIDWKSSPPLQVGSQGRVRRLVSRRTLRYTYEVANFVPGRVHDAVRFFDRCDGLLASRRLGGRSPQVTASTSSALACPRKLPLPGTPLTVSVFIA
jgi:hypothetical protein